MADWSIGVGFLVFFIAVIIAVIYYVSYRKFSIILYIASISTLIFSICYAIDVFDFNRHWILATLVLSTILFYGIGKYFEGVSYEKVNDELGIEQAKETKKENN